MTFLDVRGLSKRFAGAVALKGIDFDAELGEVHAIVGANGAGKSTLMNILAGVTAPSAGEIRLDGKPVVLNSPRGAQARGISTVFQEFSLVPQLSVARNVFLGREPRTRFRLVDAERLDAETRALLARHHLRLDPAAPVETLSVAQQQLVEIARALSVSARVLILDEPTAVLSLNEQQNLFAIIAGLKRAGLLVLYVSHRLDEIFAIADRVTVLRDGEKIATAPIAEIDQAALVRMMIGRAARQSFALPPVEREAPPLVEVGPRGDGDGDGGLSVRPGEIVGLAGFVGAGRTHLARRLIGLGEADGIEVRLDGRPRRIRSVADAMRHGIVYLTEDRKRDGLFANLSVLSNATAASLGLAARGGLIRRRLERERGGAMLERLRLVARSLDVPVRELSGGNQQKVIFGRALLRKPRLLICDEPTRGVDVGAKDEIYDLLIELAGEGVAIIVISSEVKELLTITHRILVMRDRAIVAAMDTADADEHRILSAATGAALETQ